MPTEAKSKPKDNRPSFWDDALFLSRCRQVAALNGWSIEEFSERAGFDRYFLSKAAPVGRRIDGVIALAKIGGVTLDWLAGLQDTVGPQLNSTELARLGAVANVAVHLYTAVSMQSSDMDAHELVTAVLRVIRQAGGKDANSAVGEEPTRSATARSRNRQTNPPRSNNL